jgi:hypothetical protein
MSSRCTATGCTCEAFSDSGLRRFSFNQLCDCGHIDWDHGFGDWNRHAPTPTLPNTVWFAAFRDLLPWSHRWFVLPANGGPLDLSGEVDKVISFYARFGYREESRSYAGRRPFWRRSRLMLVTLSRLPSSAEIARRSVTVVETGEKPSAETLRSP